MFYLNCIDNKSGKTMDSANQSKIQLIFRRRKDDETHGISTTNKKKLRFRNSLSEGDLLQEINNALTFSKGFLFAHGRKQTIMSTLACTCIYCFQQKAFKYLKL